jgi:hypothetical protein
MRIFNNEAGSIRDTTENSDDAGKEEEKWALEILF